MHLERRFLRFAAESPAMQPAPIARRITPAGEGNSHVIAPTTRRHPATAPDRSLAARTQESPVNQASRSHPSSVHHHGRDAGVRRARLWSACQAHRDRTHERRELQHAAAFLVEPRHRRRSLRVPDRSRRGVHELGARVRAGRLHHQEHDRHRPKDAPQRHVLLACARAEPDRQLAVRLVGHAVVHDGLDLDALAHLADERRVADLSAAAAAELVERRRRTEVPADGRHRPGAGGPC